MIRYLFPDGASLPPPSHAAAACPSRVEDAMCCRARGGADAVVRGGALGGADVGTMNYEAFFDMLWMVDEQFVNI